MIQYHINMEDALIMARTVYGEARGEEHDTKIAVAHVILNRTGTKKDHTLAASCLRAMQFSCWNEGDPNREKLMEVSFDDEDFISCLECVMKAMNNYKKGIDPTNRANHYHNKDMDDYPYWAEGRTPVASIGPFHFYNLSS